MARTDSSMYDSVDILVNFWKFFNFPAIFLGHILMLYFLMRSSVNTTPFFLVCPVCVFFTTRGAYISHMILTWYLFGQTHACITVKQILSWYCKQYGNLWHCEWVLLGERLFCYAVSFDIVGVQCAWTCRHYY